MLRTVCNTPSQGGKHRLQQRNYDKPDEGPREWQLPWTVAAFRIYLERFANELDVRWDKKKEVKDVLVVPNRLQCNNIFVL